MGSWVYDRPSLRDFFTLVFLNAPEFRKEDFLSPGEQLNLDIAFDELDQGLVYLRGLKKDTKRLAEIRNQLSAAKEAFRNHDREAGCQIMEDLEPLLFGRSARK